VVFQSLEHTVNIPPEQWRVLDQAIRKRNLAQYKGHVDIDRSLVEGLNRVALDFASRAARLSSVRASD
jgi:hypothetical protein